MINLPYKLSEGVTATQEGLRLHTTSDWMRALHNELSGSALDIRCLHWEPYTTIPWPDAAERLRYREGEPWCWYWPEFDVVRNEPANYPELPDSCPLHRVAAILCDDGAAHRRLYWCINNLLEALLWDDP